MDTNGVDNRKFPKNCSFCYYLTLVVGLFLWPIIISSLDPKHMQLLDSWPVLESLANGVNS